MAQHRLEGQVVLGFPGKELDIAVELFAIELTDGTEQGLVEVGQSHLDLRLKRKKRRKNFEKTLTINLAGALFE